MGKIFVVDVNQEEKKLNVELYKPPPGYNRDRYELKLIKEVKTEKYVDDLDDARDIEINYIDNLDDDRRHYDEDDRDVRDVEDECRIDFQNETNKIRISNYLHRFFLRHEDYYLDLSPNQACVKVIAGKIDVLFKVKDKYRDDYKDLCLSKNLSPIALKDMPKKQLSLEIGNSYGHIFSHLHYSDELAKMESLYEVGTYIRYKIGPYRIRGRLKVKSPPFKVKFSYYPDRPGFIEVEVNEFFTFYVENHFDFSVSKDAFISEVAEFEIERIENTFPKHFPCV
jgi:hypothetical protein